MNELYVETTGERWLRLSEGVLRQFHTDVPAPFEHGKLMTVLER